MDMQKRPLGITALAFTSIVVGLYCQVAAIALLLGGMVGGVFSADITAVVIAIGALYLGLMGAAYFVGFGFWTQRHWSWAGGIVVFSTAHREQRRCSRSSPPTWSPRSCRRSAPGLPSGISSARPRRPSCSARTMPRRPISRRPISPKHRLLRDPGRAPGRPLDSRWPPAWAATRPAP